MKAILPARMFSGTSLVLLVLLVIVFSIAILPLIYVVNAAFYQETSLGLSDERSLTAILNVYTTARYLGFLLNAIVLAAVVTAISLVVGVTMAVIIGRSDIGFKPLWELLIVMPLFLSPFTGLIAWVALGSDRTGFVNVALTALLGTFIEDPGPIIRIWTYGGVVWVMFLFFCPFAYLFTIGSLRSMDSSLEEAARMVGASYWRTLTRITLRLSTPAIFASGMLILILGAEMYTIPGIIGTSAGFTTLPWQMFQDTTVFPVKHAHAAAAGTILLWLTAVGVYFQHRMTRSAEKFVTVTGKGFKGSPIRLGPMKWLAIPFLLLYVGSAVILPFGALIMSSLMKYSAPMITADLFTFKHYVDFFSIASMRQALLNTIYVSVAAGVGCVLLGFLISYIEVRRPAPTTKLLAFMGVLPVAVPGLVYGTGLLWTYLQTPLYGTLTILFLCYVAKFLPYGIIVSRTGILQIHTDLEQSARMSGAGPTRVLAFITVPLVKTTLIAVLFFVVLMSVKELSASILLYTQRSQVLSVLTWHYMDAGNYQFAAAVGVIQSTLIILVIVATRLIFQVSLFKSIGKK